MNLKTTNCCPICFWRLGPMKVLLFTTGSSKDTYSKREAIIRLLQHNQYKADDGNVRHLHFDSKLNARLSI